MTELHLNDPKDTLKSVRETLCWAQFAVSSSPTQTATDKRAVARLGRMIAEIDRQRPLGPDGKHGDRHTDTCGCEDKPRTLPWQVGGSNDERHHWFLFRWTDYEGGNYEIRGPYGEAVSRREGGYVVYHTKKAATEALRRLTDV